ncbi:hypothetical protein CEXT_186781 [Caerostris extrusa]|uniref:Uncharacterized protein n=1 Tax=Caerostris extrusa TaxID=172846 RepID=A0AAV4NRT7_CAEEX|nr:hypothetical protein CEXT_186781 [Caerostris extrusa]
MSNVPEITERNQRGLNAGSNGPLLLWKTPAKELVITEIKQSIAFRKTFTERRATCWIEEPFTGGAVDKQEMGEPPDIEDIPATPLHCSRVTSTIEIPTPPT